MSCHEWCWWLVFYTTLLQILVKHDHNIMLGSWHEVQFFLHYMLRCLPDKNKLLQDETNNVSYLAHEIVIRVHSIIRLRHSEHELCNTIMLKLKVIKPMNQEKGLFNQKFLFFGCNKSYCKGAILSLVIHIIFQLFL